MSHSTKIRAAILTSIGLLPLACWSGRTADNDDSTAQTNPNDREATSDTSRTPRDTAPARDDENTEPTPAPLQSCGQGTVVIALAEVVLPCARQLLLNAGLWQARSAA